MMCHCHQFRNPHPQRPDNPISSCPIKCRNPETGEVYEYDIIKRRVTCPACLCNCSAAFEVRQAKRISSATRRQTSFKYHATRDEYINHHLNLCLIYKLTYISNTFVHITITLYLCYLYFVLYCNTGISISGCKSRKRDGGQEYWCTRSTSS